MKARFEHIPPGHDDPDPLPGDFILLDEAQDTNPVLEDSTVTLEP